MSEQKSSNEAIAKAAKRNTFPNITTAYAALNAKTSIHSDTSRTIVENNKKAP
ncbi:hypothetical protein [Pelosinus baikalensis]|uniref:Uncharacterized protein n=1 Tax=Pelosinus baikalensis TaxID=2892015 RepID=A0ABS8HQD2_9FIRM|nr:hypothetical protein [Pelosinus baikalensis]MCC5465378.1 hypothetical protein [Pelosinus baikalensis]